jgi:hypothetical protein
MAQSLMFMMMMIIIIIIILYTYEGNGCCSYLKILRYSSVENTAVQFGVWFESSIPVFLNHRSILISYFNVTFQILATVYSSWSL